MYARDICSSPEISFEIKSFFLSKEELSRIYPERTTLLRYGSNTRNLPNSSKSIDNSIGPKSKPPDSLENGIASQPCSAKSFHFSGSKPDSVLMKFSLS